jgi:branched-chain amino acid transport system ATP-binding protein
MSTEAAAPSESAAGGPGDAILSATGVSKVFGGLVAVDSVDFQIPRGGIVSIIGPNGAGKTTFFNMLTGLYKPNAGTFQNIRLFGTMSAVENVMVGQHARMRSGLFGSIFRPPWTRREERDVREKAEQTLKYVGLREALIHQMSSNLSYGDQRRIEIARAIASEPKLLLLDEPTAGMNPEESARLTAFMRQLRDERSLTILLIEHDMKVVMGVSEEITVLDHGEKIAEGSPQEVRNNDRVVEAYLGSREARAVQAED